MASIGNLIYLRRLITDLTNFFQYSCFDLNILHCDIKPSNILLDNEKKAFVTDFGISKMIENNECMHATHAVAGTREYMAPELLFTNEQTVKSELYSLGITIYEFLTGEHPYANELDLENNLQRVSKNINLLKKRFGKAMLLYINFIERCISIESSKRPENFKLNGSTKNLECSQPDHKEKSRRTLIDSISMQASYYRKENNYIKSEQILHDAINSYGKDPVLLNGLGITYADSRSREEAIVQLEEASEIIFEAHGLLDSLLYLDPIMNLSIQYRCTTRHHDAFVVLNRAWQIFRKHKQTKFLYAEFGWMMIYERDFLGACAYMEECFLKRSIQPFEMLFFTESAWITGTIKKYADHILSNVIYNQQFNCSYFLCAFLLSKYASEDAVKRMMNIIDQKILIEIKEFEDEFKLSEYGLRPPADKSIEKFVILGIDNIVTGGRHEKEIIELEMHENN